MAIYQLEGMTITNLTSTATLVTATLTIGPNVDFGPREVQVVTNAGVSNPVTFTVTETPQPQITTLTPNQAERGTSFTLQVAGSNLTDAQSLTFNPADGITVTNLTSTATSATATVSIAANAATGTRTVQVTTAVGTSNSLPFTVQAPPGPQITTLTPNEAERGTAFVLQIAGTNLANAADVIFTPSDGILISNLSSTATLVTVTVEIDPDVDPGERQVQAMTSAGLSNALPFTILAPAAPVITELIPAMAHQGDNFTLVINGTNLADVSSLNFDSGQGITISDLSSTETQVTATVEIQLNAEPGIQQVSVTTPAGDSNQLPLTITAIVPQLESVTPSYSVRGDSVHLELVGVNLDVVTGLVFTPPTGITLQNLSVTSATTASANISIDSDAEGGVRQLAVTTPFVQSNSLGYTILESCVASGAVTAESGGLVGGDIARSGKGHRIEIQPRYVGSPTTNASTLDWQGDQPDTGEVVIDLDLTQVDGDAEITATLNAAMGAEGQAFASPVTATVNGSVSVGSGSVGISVTTTFDENGVVTATDGDFGLGQNVAGKAVTGQVTVAGGGHLTLTYTASSTCSPLASGVRLGFSGDIGVSCRPVGSRATRGQTTAYRKSVTWRSGSSILRTQNPEKGKKEQRKKGTVFSSLVPHLSSLGVPPSTGFPNPEPGTRNPEPGTRDFVDANLDLRPIRESEGGDNQNWRNRKSAGPGGQRTK